MIRITTGGVLKTYRAGLNNSATNLNDAQTTVLTQRNYNSFGEDPTSAAREFQLRRSWHRTDSEYTVCSNTISKFETAWQSLATAKEVVSTTTTSATYSALRANNDADAGGRTALAAQLYQLSESIVQTMNNRYGDNFLFSGSDGQNVPFVWEGDTLTYRGIDVSSTNPEEQSKLDALANETNYVDIGIGLQEDENGNLIQSSAYDEALPGINYIGYGVDEDGDPKNIACIVRRMSQILNDCDVSSGAWASDDDREEFNRLMNKLDDAIGVLDSAYVQLDAKSSFLKTNQSQLQLTANTINEQFLEISQPDMADSITAYSWAQYCYSAALKVGNSILSESLIDYMD